MSVVSSKHSMLIVFICLRFSFRVEIQFVTFRRQARRSVATSPACAQQFTVYLPTLFHYTDVRLTLSEKLLLKGKYNNSQIKLITDKNNY